MADPYATKAPDLSGRPTGPPPWERAVGELGGAVLGADGDVPEARFLVVHCRGIGTLAPVARLEPALAVLLWVEHVHARGGGRGAEAPNRLLADLRSASVPTYALKQGCVGGPSDRAGCFALAPSLIEAVLEAVANGTVGWEHDPDFGYEVPSDVPGLSGDEARALLPRLLYGDHDRVYEHASLVAAKKHGRSELARSIPGLDPAIVEAACWPPKATAAGWRE